MKCNISRFRFLFFSLLFSFSFILIAPADTFATRIEIDPDSESLRNYFISSNNGSINYDIPTKWLWSYSGNYSGYLLFSLNVSTEQTLSCSDYLYTNVIYGSEFSSFIPSSISPVEYVSGSFNDGIIYRRSVSSNYRAPIFSSSGIPLNSTSYSFESIILGCSEEEVSRQTPTPTPTTEPTPTQTAEPTPTPTITPGETVDPNDYEYNQMEDTAVRYSFYAFCIICLSAFLIYKIIIERIILK